MNQSSLRTLALSALAILAISGSGLTTVATWQANTNAGQATITSGEGWSQNIPWETVATKLVGNDKHTAVIDGEGQLWIWGENGNLNPLPVPGTASLLTPTKILEGHKIEKIFWTNIHAGWAQEDNGQLWTWGINRSRTIAPTNTSPLRQPTKINTPATFTQIIQDKSGSIIPTTLAIDTDGNLWAWGYERSSLYADGPTNNNHASGTPQKTATGYNFKYLFTGSSTAYAITQNDKLYAWGKNGSLGLVGVGTKQSEYDTPQPVAPHLNFSQIAAGSSHVLALTTEGQLYAWGSNYAGKLGDGTATTKKEPTLINLPLPANTKIIQIAAAGSQSFALDTQGNLWDWGENEYGQLGDGTTDNHPTPTPIQGHKFVAVNAGRYHTVAIDADGHLWAFGSNSGKLGTGDTESHYTPTRITSNINTIHW